MNAKNFALATGMSYLTVLRNVRTGKLKGTKKRVCEVDIPEDQIPVGLELMKRWITKPWIRNKRKPLPVISDIIK